MVNVIEIQISVHLFQLPRYFLENYRNLGLQGLKSKRKNHAKSWRLVSGFSGNILKNKVIKIRVTDIYLTTSSEQVRFSKVYNRFPYPLPPIVP